MNKPNTADFLNPRTVYKMYHLTMYNLSDIQKGIQSYHSGIEYASRYGDTKEFKTWMNFDKTVIILDGGTSQSMEEHQQFLSDNNIKHSYFREPDLNNSLSAIAFLVPHQVFDRDRYMDFQYFHDAIIENNHNVNTVLEYRKYMNGAENVILREFINKFNLA